MARPPQDAIDTFVSITGATEAVALRKLEEHGGDLNGAVNAYFNEGERTNVNSSAPPVVDDDFMNIDDPVDVEPPVPALPLLSSAQNLNPFALFNSSFGRNYFDSEGINDFSRHGPRVSHPRDVRQVPIEFKDGDTQPASSGYGPRIEEITESVPENGQTDHTGTENAAVIIDDDDDDDDYVPSAVDNHGFNHRISSGRHPGPSVAPSVDVVDYNNDIEEEMLRAAIEASKRDAEGYSYQQSDVPDDPVGHSKSPVMADSEFARAVSMSIETAERERTLRNQGVQTAGPSSNSSDAKLEDVGKAPAADGRQGFIVTNTELSKSLVKEGDPSVQEETEELDEQPLVRHRSRRFSSGSVESAKTADSPPSSPQYDDISSQPNGDSFPSEWGGISSEEHDEAVMLEAAIFGGIPESSTYRYAYPPLQSGSDTTPNLYPRMPRPPSPNLTAQRLLREQQDDEYLAALQADREKELKAIQEAERRRLEEAAAKEAAVEKEKLEKEEARLRLIEQEEFERTLAAKEASLPQEPSSDDENAVTLLIRMPDGSRLGRRFLKSNKLQFLFDYIDVGRVVKPGTYRLVRPYPRRAFADGESNLTLSELGLTSKQEALFLELI